jgi:hypothetical protein
MGRAKRATKTAGDALGIYSPTSNEFVVELTASLYSATPNLPKM